MSLLSYREICILIDTGVIEGALLEDVNSSSLDIHLGQYIQVERCGSNQVSLARREPMLAEQLSIRNTGYGVAPGEFILAQSREVFNLPDHISAEYKLKSSMARIGLDHLNAGWCDAGWNGSVLTLELKNLTRYHEILIQEGDAIGQMIFFSHTPVPPSRSYAVRGRYNGDKQVSGAKNASPRKDS